MYTPETLRRLSDEIESIPAQNDYGTLDEANKARSHADAWQADIDFHKALVEVAQVSRDGYMSQAADLRARETELLEALLALRLYYGEDSNDALKQADAAIKKGG